MLSLSRYRRKTNQILVSLTVPITLFGGGTAINHVGGTLTALGSTGAWGIFAGQNVANNGITTSTLTNDGTINAGAGIVAISSNATISNTGTITAQDAGIWGYAGPAISVTNTGTITASTGTGVRFSAGGTLINNGTINAANAIIGLGSFTDTVTLGAASTTIGAVSLGAGNDSLTLNIGAIVSGTIDGGTGTDSFTVQGTGTTTLAGNITGFESLTKNGSGTLTLSGSNGAFGTVAVNAGTLNLTGSSAIGTSDAVTVLSGATFGINNNATIGSLTGAGNVLLGANTLTFGGDNSSTTYAGVASGTGGLNKAGTGIFTLSGSNTFTGTTSVQAGMLAYAANNVLADTSTLVVSSGATVNLGSFNDTIGILALGGTLAGTGTLTASQYQLTGATVNANLGAGTVFNLGGTSVLNGTSAASTYSIQAGTLRLGADERIANSAVVSVSTGATFDLGNRTETIGTLFGTGTLALGTGRLIAGGTNADFGFGGNITGSGDLDKRGTGTATLIGNYTTTGRINLFAGTTLFSGSTAGSVTIQGGTLTGAGSIAGNLALSSGTLSPGAAGQPIAMFQAGSLTATGGSFAVDVGGMPNNFAADFLRVTGAASISATTVAVRTIDPAASYRTQQFYNVLQAGTLTGSFANGSSFAQVDPSTNLLWRLRYDLVANGVVLELRKPLDFVSTLGSTGTANQNAIGTALNGSALTGSDSWVATLDQISRVSPDQQAATYNSIGGEPVSDIASSIVTVGNRFNDLVRDRLTFGSGSNNGGNGQLLAAAFSNHNNFAETLDATPTEPASRAAGNGGSEAHHGGAWIQAYGSTGHLDAQAGSARVNQFYAGIAGGVDAQFGNFTVGAAAAISRTENKIRSLSASSDGTIHQYGGYAAYDDGKTYLNVVGSYVGGNVDSRRTVTVGSAIIGVAAGKAATKGYTASATAGHRFDVSKVVRFTPQASFQAVGVTRNAFNESGAGNLSLQVGREHRNLYTASLEGRLSALYETRGAIIEPYVSAGVAHSFGDLDTLSAVRFSGAPVNTGAFSITGARLTPTAALVSGGIEVRPTHNVTLGVGADGRFSNRERQVQASMRLRIGF